jgi:hypothetical protein
MRIRVPGRFIAIWAILAAFLYLLPANTKVAVARPVGYEDVGPTNPDGGDNDGVVLKSRGGGGGGTGAASAPTTLSVQSTTTTSYSSLRTLLMVLKANYWFLWLR